jgi:hypothetical protein
MKRLHLVRTLLSVIALLSLNSCGIIGNQMRSLDRALRQPILSENDAAGLRPLEQDPGTGTAAEAGRKTAAASS